MDRKKKKKTGARQNVNGSPKARQGLVGETREGDHKNLTVLLYQIMGKKKHNTQVTQP